LAPQFRRAHRALSRPWLTMNASPRQTLDRAMVGTGAEARRRCLPPRRSQPLPMSEQRRWRERPHHCAQPLTPARQEGVVHAIGCQCPAPLRACPDRAGEQRRPHAQSGAQVSARNRVANGTEIGSGDHRIDDAGAVLAVVNALRFATTRPAAGPAGIDDACARPRLAVTRWSPSWRSFRRGLTPSTCRRSLASSRQCRTALLRFAATAAGARIGRCSQGHGSSASLTTVQPEARAWRCAAFSGPETAPRPRSPEAP